ncbi:hypothetical protein NKH81_20340 [Mesorhizobium sp. M0959]|jgi:hypothetical protein|uniref:hypothetical protein n=1 Tax=unclassified Mesorhizobium TaxID=325217 RepID=UPI00333861C1
MTLEEALQRATVSVPEAGELFFGLSKNGAYEAAARGDFETIRFGKKIVVPVAPIAEKLGLRFTAGKAAA